MKKEWCFLIEGHGLFAPRQLRPCCQLCLHCVGSCKLNPGERSGSVHTHPCPGTIKNIGVTDLKVTFRYNLGTSFSPIRLFSLNKFWYLFSMKSSIHNDKYQVVKVSAGGSFTPLCSICCGPVHGELQTAAEGATDMSVDGCGRSKVLSNATLDMSKVLSKATHVQGPVQDYPAPVPIYSVSGVQRVQRGVKAAKSAKAILN